VRYYTIIISDAVSGAEIRRYTSFVNGKTITGALNIELDVPVVPFATPMGAAIVRVWGIALQEISQASDLNGKAIAVYAGMQKGLPLANPKQAGLIVQGFIFQAFGNWVLTDMTLDLIIQPSIGSAAAPKNIVLDWRAGTPLATAIAQTLSTAFPGYKQNISINPNLVLAHDEPGYYQSLIQFAQYVKQVSQNIIKGGYTGVDIVLTETSFSVYDGTTQKSPTLIAFNDLIGQPTWIESPVIQVRCVMRADLAVGDYVKLPPTLATNTPQSFSQFRSKSVFQGVFQIIQMRHVGNFRQPDAASWVTNIDAYPTLAA
jgi:hypothetical protein